jgi:hypothetical protein
VARALLIGFRMMKPLALVAMLCVPALADTPRASPLPPSPSVQPLQVRLTVKTGTDTRTHEVAVFDQGCNRVQDKSSAYEDDINLCTRPATQGVLVEVSWQTRSGPNEYRTSSATVMPRKGGTFEVGRTGGTRFTLQMQ